MATFKVQVEALTTITISSSATYPTQAQLTQFLTDGAKEIINILPPHLLPLCAAEETFTSAAVGSEAETLNTAKILAVFSGNYEARKIPPRLKHEANNSTSINYATATDPVFYIQNNKINSLPASISCKYDEVAYPAVAYGDSAIAVFPDEAEHLVVLYGAIKSLLSAIGALEIPPNVSLEGANTASLTDDITALSTEQIGVDDEFEDFTKWFAALGEMIEDDEDIELANAQIEKINAYVNTWNHQLQGNLAEMQQYMTLFQSLKADYTMGIQMLKTGGLAPPQVQPQQARR